MQEALAAAEDPDQRRRLELVERNTHRLARMVDAMLDFGRIEAGGLAPNLEGSTSRPSSPGWPRASVRRWNGPGWPSATTAAPASWRSSTATWSSGIVLNLLANAVKYTPEGSVALTVRGVDDDVEIAVSDTGVGIHPDDVERAFARFERLPAVAGARSHEGAGIGLAIVRELTELMGGDGHPDQRRRAGKHLHGPAAGSTAGAGAGAQPGASSTMTPRRVDDFLREVQTWQQPTDSVPTRQCLERGPGFAILPATGRRGGGQPRPAHLPRRGAR